MSADTVDDDPDGAVEVLERALQGDRVAAEFIWRYIASGQVGVETRTRWVDAIAKGVVEEVLVGDAKERPTRALRAIRLAGRGDPHWELRQALRIFKAFPDLTDGPKPSRGQVAQVMLDLGYLKGKTLKQAERIIDHLDETTEPG